MEIILVEKAPNQLVAVNLILKKIVIVATYVVLIIMSVTIKELMRVDFVGTNIVPAATAIFTTLLNAKPILDQGIKTCVKYMRTCLS